MAVKAATFAITVGQRPHATISSASCPRRPHGLQGFPWQQNVRSVKPMRNHRNESYLRALSECKPHIYKRGKYWFVQWGTSGHVRKSFKRTCAEARDWWFIVQDEIIRWSIREDSGG